MLAGGNLIAVVFFLEQSKVSKQVRRCPQFGMLSDGIICASSQFGHSLHQLPKHSACKLFHTFLFYMFSIILESHNGFIDHIVRVVTQSQKILAVIFCDLGVIRVDDSNAIIQSNSI
jgi:hypothetical protein